MLNERRTYDETTMTYNIHDGMEEEVVILEFIQAKVRTMIQDQFGRIFGKSKTKLSLTY